MANFPPFDGITERHLASLGDDDREFVKHWLPQTARGVRLPADQLDHLNRIRRKLRLPPHLPDA